MKKDYIEEFYLLSEADYICKCLDLLEMSYTRNDNAISESTGMHVYTVGFTATKEQYTALVKMFAAMATA